jgi:hypothetical protein
MCDLFYYYDKEHTPGEELVFIPVPDAGLLARSQYSEGPHTTGLLDTGFSWFPCV